MRRYVIWSTTQRKYVAPPGSAKSFTSDIRKAGQFPTKEAAEADCCGDESAREIERFA